jgi:DNA-directed RNA polymerase subunit H (RpoH/RPB5)
MPDFSIKLTENGEWIHSRTVGSMYGSRNLESLANKIGHSFWRKQELPKHRYTYFLANRKETKKMIADLRIPIISFNEIELPVPLIQKINVEDGKIINIEILRGKDTGWVLDKGKKINNK